MGIRIAKGNFIVEDPDTVKGKEGGEDGGGSKSGKENIPKDAAPTELDTPEQGVIKPEFDPDGEGGPKYRRTLDKDVGAGKKEYTSKKSPLGKGGSKQEVSGNWERIKRAALAGSMTGISSAAKKILMKITSNKAKVDWLKELKKFLDESLNKYEYVIPNKRLLSRGDIVYGRKRSGKGTIKKLVLPVDTSGSISKAQIKVFLEEVMRLTTKLDIYETHIIYCSDDIDSIDKVLKGEKPDLSKWASTGGNAKGFHPPFKWMQKNKIVPSAVIYLTDSYAEYPQANQYEIHKYKDRVFWFLCNSSDEFEKPPFGKYIHVPMDRDGKFL